MRILIVGGDFREGCKITGYIIAVRETVKETVKDNEVQVIPYLPQRPELSENADWCGATILSKRPGLRIILSSLAKMPLAYRRINSYMKVYDRNRTFLKWKARAKYVSLYSFNRSFFESLLKETRPGVIHVHGVGIQTLPYHDYLLDSGIPYVTTIHGLYTNDEDSTIDFDRELEGDVLRSIDTKGFPITTVSKGVRENALALFSLDPSNVQVVSNGVGAGRFGPGDRRSLRLKHQLPLNRNIILTVGTVCKRKNQQAVLGSIALMSDSEREEILFLIVGGGDVEALSAELDQLGLKDSVIIMGKVPDDTLLDLYQLADLFVLTSTSEAFGLVFLEAMAAGLPIVTYADLEAIDELYDRDCMVLADERSPEVLLSALRMAFARDWDHEAIRKKADRWSWQEVVDRYRRIYEGLNGLNGDR